MSIDSKQLTDLVKRVSTDQKLQLTEDTSLLSEERYPFELSPLFESLTKITVIVFSAVQKVAIAGVKSDNPLH